MRLATFALFAAVGCGMEHDDGETRRSQQDEFSTQFIDFIAAREKLLAT